MGLHRSELAPGILDVLFDGTVIPAHPLALDASRDLDRRRQRALSRYYLDAGAGGLAVGVHATQLAIRNAGLYSPVLECAAQTVDDWVNRPVAMVGGLAGLDADRLPLAVEIAALAQRIRGFGHVKQRNIAAVRDEHARLMAAYREARPRPARTPERETV